MQSYNDLQQFLQDIQTRKMKLNDEKNVLIMKRQTLQEQYEDCVVSGSGIREAKQAIIDNENEIDILNDHIVILQDRVKTSSKVQELAQAAHDDCSHTLKGMRNNYISQAAKVKKCRDAYLKELAILGEINNIANRYSFFASEANTYIPGTSVHCGLNADSFKEVSLDLHEVRETYKNGRQNK